MCALLGLSPSWVCGVRRAAASGAQRLQQRGAERAAAVTMETAARSSDWLRLSGPRPLRSAPRGCWGKAPLRMEAEVARPEAPGSCSSGGWTRDAQTGPSGVHGPLGALSRVRLARPWTRRRASGFALSSLLLPRGAPSRVLAGAGPPGPAEALKAREPPLQRKRRSQGERRPGKRGLKGNLS